MRKLSETGRISPLFAEVSFASGGNFARSPRARGSRRRRGNVVSPRAGRGRGKPRQPPRGRRQPEKAGNRFPPRGGGGPGKPRRRPRRGRGPPGGGGGGVGWGGGRRGLPRGGHAGARICRPATGAGLDISD